MAMEDTRSVKLFYSYAHEDIDLRKELATHLGNRYISWHDRDIAPGMDWAREIDTHLNSADIILLLISADFMASDYCNGVEMARALERQANGEADVIPIYLRPVHWENPPFNHLQLLPTNDKGEVEAVIEWKIKDKAFANIAKGVGRAADEALKRRENSKIMHQYVTEAERYTSVGNYKSALNAYYSALQLFPNNASLYKGKGATLLAIGQSENDSLAKGTCFKEAAGAFEQAIKLITGRDAELYMRRGDALSMYAPYEALSIRAYYQKALNEYNHAIEIENGNALFYEKKGKILYKLQNYSEAVEAYQQAIDRDPGNARLWRNKAVALGEDGRFREACGAYEEAIACNPDNAVFHKEKGDVLVKLNDLPGALTAYTEAISLDPGFGFAYLSRGRVYEKMGQHDQEMAKQLGISEGNM